MSSNPDCENLKRATQSTQRSESGLPLPDPFPEYIVCTHCGELEVEVWCYQTRVQCHACGGWMDHTPPLCFGTSDICKTYDK